MTIKLFWINKILKHFLFLYKTKAKKTAEVWEQLAWLDRKEAGEPEWRPNGFSTQKNTKGDREAELQLTTLTVHDFLPK